MILVDTSVWGEHFRAGHPRLSSLLHDGLVLPHLRTLARPLAKAAAALRLAA